MFFDKLGKSPSDYKELAPDARCPECESKLYKRGGGSNKMVEHWAHYPDTTRMCWAESYSEGESHWHLTMKKGFRDSGYDVEKTIEAGGNKYRADAIKGIVIIEFINSISNTYEQKTIDLITAGYTLIWVFNGSEFSEEYIFGRELPGKAGRFAVRAQGLGASVWVYHRGQMLRCTGCKADMAFGLTSVKRSAIFFFRGYAGWMWDRLIEKRTLQEFIESKAYTAMPVFFPSNSEQLMKELVLL